MYRKTIPNPILKFGLKNKKQQKVSLLHNKLIKISKNSGVRFRYLNQGRFNVEYIFP